MKIIVQEMEHSTLGASSAHRWMKCAGSLTAESSGDSIHSQRGRVAHEVAHKCLSLGREPGYWVGAVGEGDGCDGVVFTQDMADSVSQYVDYVRSLVASPTGDQMERRMVLSHLPTGPGGTVDFHTWIGNDLYIVDYKSGAVPQNPHGNPQLMIYALAAMMEYQRKPDRVVLAVVQPKADGVLEWEPPSDVLSAFYAELQAAVTKATDGSEDHAEGDWCRWCPKMATCPLKVSKALAVHADVAPPAELSDGQLAKVLDVASDVRRFLKEAEEHARVTLEEGGQVPGYELAPARRKKVWAVDEDRVRSYLETRGISLTTPTPVGALRAVKDLPDEFWQWEIGGKQRLRKVDCEFPALEGEE